MKLLLTVIAVCTIVTVNAQRPAPKEFLQTGHFSPIQNQDPPSSDLRNVVDTIVPLSFIPANQGGLGCFTGYASTDSGYVTGNNQYGDQEKAQFYGLSHMGFANTGSLQSVLVKFAYKTLNAVPENVVIKVYAVDTSQFIPATLLGTSQPINLSAIADDGGFTVFGFDPPVIVNDSFFVSVQLPAATGDTLVILSTEDHCTGNSGWAWEQWENGTWHSIFNSWVLDVDLAIFPVIDLPFGIGIETLSSSSSIKIYPNPATDFITVQLPNEMKSPVSLRIIDLAGKVLQQFDGIQKDENRNSIQLPLNGLFPSLYILEVAGKETKSRMPFCVIR